MMSSSLSAFLGEIGRHQLLTPEQELMLGRKVQEMVAITEPVLLLVGQDHLVNTTTIKDLSFVVAKKRRIK